MRDLASGASLVRASAVAQTLGRSHRFWRWAAGSGGGGLSCPCAHNLRASDLPVRGASGRRVGMISGTRLEEPAADQKGQAGLHSVCQGHHSSQGV